MGRGDPLDSPELREIEQRLDALDLDEAQRRLGLAGQRPEHADGAAYLTTRLLYLRGKLDAKGVAVRLRDLLSRVGYFPRAAILLHEAETGHLGSSRGAPGAPAAATPIAQSNAPVPLREPTFGADESAINTDISKRASWPPEPPKPIVPVPPTRTSAAPSPDKARRLTPQWHPKSDPPNTDAPSTGAPNARPTEPVRAPTSEVPPSSERRRRHYTPLRGFDPLAAGLKPDPAKAQGTKVVDIPRAPAVPLFDKDAPPPSDGPEVPPNEFDSLRSKSLLPAGAGRYSEAPRAAERVGATVPRRSVGPSPASPGRTSRPAAPRRSSSPARARPSGPPVRSGAPGPSTDGDLPSLYELATWIDDGHFVRAIAAVNRAGPSAPPEYALLRARALAGAGYAEQAFEALRRLESAPLLDPELQAGCARLFVELGEPRRALRLAIDALNADSERSLVRLTFALAAVRCSRRRVDQGLLAKAERAVETLRSHGPLPGLAEALRACVQAGIGDPERALALAKGALGMDPKAPDAHAAMAEAYARLDREPEARKAWQMLHDLVPDEAEAMLARLASLGVRLEVPSNPAGELDPEPVWDAAETTLATGDRITAITILEELAREHVTQMATSASQSGLTAIAAVAATYLTTAPILRNFAPYDLSLSSVRRIDAALDVLYGTDRRPRLKSDEAPTILLLGAYIGEALRLAHGGRWEGRVAELDAASVVAKNRQWRPFHLIDVRLGQGRTPMTDALDDALSLTEGNPSTGKLVGLAEVPLPWTNGPWPRPSQIQRLGRAMSRSVISLFCEEHAEGPLDRTLPSLSALDTYLSIIAPEGSQPDPNAAWPRRVSVLAGAYVGEVLCDLVGGHWVFGADEAAGPTAFRALLREHSEITPVAHIHDRLFGRSPLSVYDYARTVVKRLAGR